MKYTLLLAFIALGFNLKAQDKKELNKLAKTHTEYNQGNIYAKNKSVAILGTNLRFRVASRSKVITSNKDDATVKFESFAILDSVPESVFQEITDEYYTMVKTRFENYGLQVVSPEQVREAKSYPKLAEKGTLDKENVVKPWGVAKVYSPNGQDYVSWNNAAPFGPHQKVARELKSILFSSLTTIDFCTVEMSTSSNTANYTTHKTTYVEGNATVTPVINIHGYTYPLNGLKMLEDATYTFGYSPNGKQHNTTYTGMTTSQQDYAEKIEKCATCKPEFSSKYNLMSHGIGTVVVTANPEKFKVAVLDALTLYLDEVFKLYEAQK